MIDTKLASPSLVIVLRWVGRVVMIGALCSAIGLHWVVIQSFAWTNMIVENSKRASLCEAIAQTFDGTHPCSLCHVVNKGKSSEKTSDFQSSTPKVDMICVSRLRHLIRPFIPVEYSVRDFGPSRIGRSPLVPPPRSLRS